VPPIERSTGKVELLFVGTWTPRKQLVRLLEALARLDSDYQLTVVGDPERDPSYAAQVRAALAGSPEVARRVTLVGKVDDARLAALHASSDLFVSPSDFEGYGMAIAEAVHAGLPVVAASGGAVPEVLRDGEEAILVPPVDTSALARALEQVIRDPRCRARMRRCAQSRRLPRWSESVERFERLLTTA
jgi:glycosyltransferase involved in cell wall biosynthesis